MASTNSVVTSNKVCHPLKAVCVFLNAISSYLYRKDFMQPALSAPLITEDTQIRFLKAVLDDKPVTADPMVTYKVNGYEIGLTPYGRLNAPMYNPNTLAGAITFTVSTVSDIFTEALAFEIGTYSMAIRRLLEDDGMIINHATISEVGQDEKSVFFIATAKIGFSLSYPVWNTTELEGILREVRLDINTQ